MSDDVKTPAKVVSMPRQSVVSQILAGVKAPAAPTAVPAATLGDEAEFSTPAKKSDPLPKPNDPYRASAQFMSRLGTGERMIDFVDRDCFSEGFSYGDLRRVSWRKSKTGGGPDLVLLFLAGAKIEVSISGRHLDEIRHYIREGMMPWVWEQPANYRPKSDQTPVITRIEINEVEN